MLNVLYICYSYVTNRLSNLTEVPFKYLNHLPLASSHSEVNKFLSTVKVLSFPRLQSTDKLNLTRLIAVIGNIECNSIDQQIRDSLM